MSYWNTRPGIHAHTCDECSFTWEHPDNTMYANTDEEFVDAHTCSRCGAKQLSKAEPDDAKRCLQQQGCRLR